MTDDAFKKWWGEVPVFTGHPWRGTAEIWNKRRWVPGLLARTFNKLPSWRIFRPMLWLLFRKTAVLEGVYPKSAKYVDTKDPR